MTADAEETGPVGAGADSSPLERISCWSTGTCRDGAGPARTGWDGTDVPILFPFDGRDMPRWPACITCQSTRAKTRNLAGSRERLGTCVSGVSVHMVRSHMLTLPAKDPTDIALLTRLIGAADVFVQNLAPVRPTVWGRRHR
jgi:hypothetical protein